MKDDISHIEKMFNILKAEITNNYKKKVNVNQTAFQSITEPNYFNTNNNFKIIGDPFSDITNDKTSFKNDKLIHKKQNINESSIKIKIDQSDDSKEYSSKRQTSKYDEQDSIGDCINSLRKNKENEGLDASSNSVSIQKKNEKTKLFNIIRVEKKRSFNFNKYEFYFTMNKIILNKLRIK